jgi:hypothetical protein
MHAHITRNFRQFILTKYPALRDNEPFLRFFHYLCFSTFFDKETGQLVVPVRTIAEEFCQKPYGGDFNGKAFFERFRAAVLPGLTWGSYDSSGSTSWKGKAREIIDFGFDQEMWVELQRELRSDSDDTGRSRHWSRPCSSGPLRRAKGKEDTLPDRPRSARPQHNPTKDPRLLENQACRSSLLAQTRR